MQLPLQRSAHTVTLSWSYIARIAVTSYIQCAKILHMRKIEVTRTWYRVVSRSSVYHDRAQAHGCRSEKWPWAIVEDCIVVVGDGLQKVVGPKPDLPNRLLRPWYHWCNIPKFV